MALITTDDGSHSLYSERYGVTYHSKYGAVTESGHVFIDAGLRYKAVVQREISLLEIGLGTALNAFMTWLEAEKRNLRVRYTAVEAYPLALKEAAVFNFAAQLRAPERHADFLRLHRCAWEKPHCLSNAFTFTKHRVRLEDFSPGDATFDLIYFDAFAPQAQPELWTEAIFARLYAALNPEGVLVTYCAKGDVKRTLKKVGFEVERLQGPPGKREMTRGYCR
ncbi:MAG: tRNA (5-methylaminomethyl-2-thiouridine)(34)-methyltransferase MnmD [Thermoanaerobaculia bacterium]|nr:tRNA (5-methylaminomethyl-2-thiouridine)(34)-methyltransferase MnmD [Thermoanaerobaculia bacterium]